MIWTPKTNMAHPEQKGCETRGWDRSSVTAGLGHVLRQLSLYWCTSTGSESIYRPACVRLCCDGRWSPPLVSAVCFAVDLLCHRPKQLTNNLSHGKSQPCQGTLSLQVVLCPEQSSLGPADRVHAGEIWHPGCVCPTLSRAVDRRMFGFHLWSKSLMSTTVNEVGWTGCLVLLEAADLLWHWKEMVSCQFLPKLCVILKQTCWFTSFHLDVLLFTEGKGNDMLAPFSLNTVIRPCLPHMLDATKTKPQPGVTGSITCSGAVTDTL